MNILINCANPALEFYSKLLYLLHSGVFIKRLAEDLVEIKDANPDLIKLDVDLETIEGWYESSVTEDDEEMQMKEDITVQCFADLSSQMRTDAARDLFAQWVETAAIPNDLFIHLRKKKELGEKVASVTLVTNDIDKFEEYFKNPQKCRSVERVHFTS